MRRAILWVLNHQPRVRRWWSWEKKNQCLSLKAARNWLLNNLEASNWPFHKLTHELDGDKYEGISSLKLTAAAYAFSTNKRDLYKPKRVLHEQKSVISNDELALIINLGME